MSILQNLINSKIETKVFYRPDKDGDYVVVVPSISNYMSIALKLIMYRLNNIEGNVRLFILDKKKVNLDDVENGIFTEDDLGKDRTSTFIQSVAINFDNITTIDVINSQDITKINEDDTNIIFIDYSEKISDNRELFDKLLFTKAFKRFRTNNMYIHLGKNKNYNYMTLDCYSLKAYESKRELKEIKSLNKLDKHLNSVMMTRLLSGVINIMVTEGFSLSKNSFGIDDKNVIEFKEMEEI